MTDEQREDLGVSLTNYFADRDRSEEPDDRILAKWDYCDSRNVDDLIERAILPHVVILPKPVDPRSIDAFSEWFAKHFPRDSVITDPHWHAPKIYRAVLAVTKPDLRNMTDLQRVAVAIADERMTGHGLPAYSELLAQIGVQTENEPPREVPDTLFNAALDCPHSIDNWQVALKYDPDRPGHNAVAQLALRLAAVRPLAPTPKTLEEAQIWLNQNAPGFNGAPAVIQTIAEADIRAERERQDKQWGGPAHDDEHTTGDFIGYVQRQCNLASLQLGEPAVSRSRFVKIAALAVAAIESIDRKTKA
jgi:hypothetical protein